MAEEYLTCSLWDAPDFVEMVGDASSQEDGEPLASLVRLDEQNQQAGHMLQALRMLELRGKGEQLIQNTAGWDEALAVRGKESRNYWGNSACRHLAKAMGLPWPKDGEERSQELASAYMRLLRAYTPQPGDSYLERENKSRRWQEDVQQLEADIRARGAALRAGKIPGASVVTDILP